MNVKFLFNTKTCKYFFRKKLINRIIVFENIESLKIFVDDPHKMWKEFESMMKKQPSIIILMNLHLKDPFFKMFKEVFLKPRNQVFIKTIEKEIQTPVHFVEKKIGTKIFTIDIKFCF